MLTALELRGRQALQVDDRAAALDQPLVQGLREIEKGFGCDRCWIYKENEVSYGIEEEDMICLRKDCTYSDRKSVV